jgi:hypothetical protein
VPLAKAPSHLKAKGGTSIEIKHLLNNVASEFNIQKSQFIETLRTTIATHYSYIIHKGFSIEINGQKIKPKALGLLFSEAAAKADKIAPFVYEANQDSVKVELLVGLYREIPEQKEIDDELNGRTSASRYTCGWTVICNDRVVVYSDRSRLTGWGEATVPAYHPQFNAIAGIVRFTSDDMSKLPVTTTKRGLEANSELYLTVKDVMREGLKHFTNFTNQWKEHGGERKVVLQAATSVDPFSVASLVKPTEWSSVRKGLLGRKFVPRLPTPRATVTPSGVTIRFVRPSKNVEVVADLLFNDRSVEPSRVGEVLFDQAFARASK